jgi:hypothetical protein
MAVTEAPSQGWQRIRREDGKSGSAGLGSPKKATYGLTVGIPKVAAPRLSGDRNGKIREVTGHAVSGAHCRLRNDVGGSDGNPRNEISSSSDWGVVWIL